MNKMIALLGGELLLDCLSPSFTDLKSDSARPSEQTAQRERKEHKSMLAKGEKI